LGKVNPFTIPSRRENFEQKNPYGLVAGNETCIVSHPGKSGGKGTARKNTWNEKGWLPASRKGRISIWSQPQATEKLKTCPAKY
jgi:hypothetical protein